MQLQWNYRLSSEGQEPKPAARGHELKTFRRNGPEAQRGPRLRDTAAAEDPQIFRVLSEDKIPGAPLFGVPLWKHQLELLFCYFAI